MANYIVIKCGGSMIEDLSNEFFEDIKNLQKRGYKPIIVHGGGPAINTLLENLQIESEFVNGLRKTTKEVMDVVEMVLSGTITNKLVRSLQKHSIPSIGITGSDGGLMYAQAKDYDSLGLVGEVTKVNSTIIKNLMDIGMVPVISPIAVDPHHERVLNINADTAAASIAVSVKADKILFVTDVPGILKNNEVIENASRSDILTLIENGTISGGMIPKVMAAIHSLDGGMNEAMIVSGKSKLLKGEEFVGTSIHKELEAVQ